MAMGSEPRGVSNLSDDLLRAIGAVSAERAVLEYEMSRATVACLTAHGNATSKNLDNLSFLARRVAFEEFLRAGPTCPNPSKAMVSAFPTG